MAPDGGQNVKWMTAVSVWLFLAMTSALVTTKVSLLWILRLYKYEQIHPATWYVIMAVLLTAPLLCHVVHLVWNTPFINGGRVRLPRTSIIMLGLLGSMSESVAGVVFATECSYVLPEPVLLLLPAAVFTLHLVLSTGSVLKMKTSSPDEKESETQAAEKTSINKPQGKRPWRNTICIIMSSYLLWAPSAVATILHMWSSFNMTLGACLALPPALLVLSVTWSPHLQSAVARVKGSSGQGGSSSSNSSLSLIYTLIRVGTTLLTLYLVMFFKIDSFRHDAVTFLRHALFDLKDVRVWLPVLLVCLFGLVSLLIAGLASKVALLTPGVRIPAFVTPAVSFAMAMVLWKDIESRAFWELSGSDVVTWTTSGVALAAWLVPFLVPGISLIGSPRELLRPFSDNFHSFSWRSFFLEQHLMLNTHTNTNGQHSDDDNYGCLRRHPSSAAPSTSGRMKRVYICTTMYRETAEEMRRYLKSLKKAFTSDRLLNVELETHIFLDNCVEDDLQVNSYASQLLSLLCSVLSIPSSALRCFDTPYGCQVWCRCLGGNLLFVHCKNGKRFKPKKRWSQVMYMHYILNHRAKLGHSNIAYTVDTPSKHQVEHVAQCQKITDKPITQPCSQSIISGGGHDAPKSDVTGEECAENYVICIGRRSGTNDDSHSCSCSGASVKVTTSNKDTTGCPGTTTTSGSGSRFSTTCGTEQGHLRGIVDQEFVAGSFNKDKRTMANQSQDSRSQTPLCNVNGAGKGDYSSSSLTGAGFLHDRNRGIRDSSGVHVTAKNFLRHQPGDDVYILATDADTEFSGGSVRALLDQCEADESLGAVCGRTVPIGGLKPIVCYQKFEYAKDFWLVKSSQNVIGSVTCCPGCFSMYRGSALRDVMDTFSRPSQSAYDTLVKDHGEDRWLCTLMMQKGWKLEFSDSCRNSTHCPETWGEFLRQRRRWVLSELSNMLLIFQGLGHLIRGNVTFSATFVLSLLHMFVWVLLSPSTILVVSCVALHTLFHVPMLGSAPIAFCFLLLFFGVCMTQSRPRQRLVTQVVVAVMVGVMLSVSVGFVRYVVVSLTTDLEAGQVQFKPYCLVLALIGGTLYAALLHANDGPTTICYGLVYAAIFPAMFLALPVYSIANMVDTSWGTRELGGSRSCCGVTVEEASDGTGTESGQFKMNIRDLPALSAGDSQQRAEHDFWRRLQDTILGCQVNHGESPKTLSHDLIRVRNRCVCALFVVNSVWYVIMTSIYVLVSSDIVCYVIAFMFSFALIVQLVGMTSYKVDQFLKTYIVRKMYSPHLYRVKGRS